MPGAVRVRALVSRERGVRARAGLRLGIRLRAGVRERLGEDRTGASGPPLNLSLALNLIPNLNLALTLNLLVFSPHAEPEPTLPSSPSSGAPRRHSMPGPRSRAA